MAHDGERDGRLSAARFPYEAMRFAGHEREIEVDHRGHGAASACVGNGQIPAFQKRHVARAGGVITRVCISRAGSFRAAHRR